MMTGITESSTDPPAVPPANQISDVFGKRQPLGRCGGGSVESNTWTAGTRLAAGGYGNVNCVV